MTKPIPNAEPAVDPDAPDPGAPDPGAPDPGAPDPGAPDPGAPDPDAPVARPCTWDSPDGSALQATWGPYDLASQSVTVTFQNVGQPTPPVAVGVVQGQIASVTITSLEPGLGPRTAHLALGGDTDPLPATLPLLGLIPLDASSFFSGLLGQVPVTAAPGATDQDPRSPVGEKA